MRRRFFWGMVAVAVTTLLVGGLAAAALISRSVEASARAEFARQAAATGRLLEADLPAGALGEGRARLIQILRDVALVGGHDFVEAAVVGPRGAVTPLGEGGVLLVKQQGRIAVGDKAEVLHGAGGEPGQTNVVEFVPRIGQAKVVLEVAQRVFTNCPGKAGQRFLSGQRDHSGLSSPDQGGGRDCEPSDDDGHQVRGHPDGVGEANHFAAVLDRF